MLATVSIGQSRLMLANTTFLQFRHAPPALCPYLIKEISGGYLIQTFPGENKRIFLRKQLLP
jgi:hypothetical protein